LADARSFYNKNVKEFAVVVSITKPPANVKLGLTGLAEINVAESDK
jgi:hypothetical protein